MTGGRLTPDDGAARRARRWAAVGLIGLVVGLGIAMPFVDRSWTLWLIGIEWSGLNRWMSPSIFEGDAFGGSDVPVSIAIVAAVGYLLGCLPVRRLVRLRRLQAPLGFILMSALLNAVLLVHVLKSVMGRARPNQVFDGLAPYTEWYAFGPHFMTGAAFQGSFPSGHAAAASLLLPVAYLLIAGAWPARGRRAAGLAMAVLGLGYALAMALSRVMTGSHWIGDGLLTIAAAWLVTHALFDWLRVAERMAVCREPGVGGRCGVGWEVGLALLFALAATGVWCAAIGARAFGAPARPGLAWLIPLGLWLLVASVRRLPRARRAMLRAYGLASGEGSAF